MDIAITQDPLTGAFHLAYNAQGNDLATVAGLTTAVIISLFTDRQADPDDVLPDGGTDRRGWWADTTMGSRLWLLSREKEISAVLGKARQYAEEALAWLLDDGVASAVTVITSWYQEGVLLLRVRIDRAQGGTYEELFTHALNDLSRAA